MGNTSVLIKKISKEIKKNAGIGEYELRGHTSFPFFLIPVSYFFAFLYLLLFSNLTQVYATDLPALSISPSIVSLDLSTDQPKTTISYKNNSEEAMQIHVSAKDFSAIDDSGRFDFIEGQDAKNYHYSLSSWIHFDNSDFTLEPHEEKSIQITIDTNKVTIGGHYASLLAEIVTTPQRQSTITVRSIAATVLFLRTGSGREREEGHITEVTIDQTFFSFPQRATLRFENTGNVQVIPHGYVEISDMFGSPVAKGIINEGSSYTLPESIRKYNVSLSGMDPFIFPGWYRSDTYVHFGQKDKKLYSHQTIFTFGCIPVIPALLVLSILILLIKRFYKKTTHFITTLFMQRSKS